MNLTAKKKLYLVTGVFILAKIAFLILIWNLIAGLKPDPSIQTAIEQLKTQDSSLIYLDHAKQNVTEAEINYRDFLSTKDPASKMNFTTKLEAVSSNLERVNFSDPSIADQLKNELGEKLSVSETIASLKGMADQLLTDTYAADPGLSADRIKLGKISTSILKNNLIVKVDTLKAVQEKKGFFKKIFGGGSDSAKYELAEGEVNQQTETDSTMIAAGGEDDDYDQLANAVSKYYQEKLDQQIRLRNSIDQKELALSKSNMLVMQQINSGIDQISTQVEQIRNEQSIAALGAIEDQNKQVRKNSLEYLIYAIVFGLTLLLVFIFYIRSYNKEEVARIKANQLAEDKARMLSSMSHEIRSPLTAIMGFAEQLSFNPSIQFNVDYIGAIKKSSEHLLSTVNDILEYSKLESGKLKIVKEDFLVKDVLDEVMYNFSILAKNKGIYLKLHSTVDKDMVLKGDAFRLKQVLINLISNAIKFTKEGGVDVIAETRSTDDQKVQLYIKVKDTGNGIPTDQQDLIFKEFMQVTNKYYSALDARRGTGLGLFISKMLVELQNGEIGFESKVNVGTTFKFNIPYSVSKHKLILPVQKTELNKFEFLAGKRILLVEDSPINVMLLEHILKKYKLTFEVANSGKLAWDIYQSQQFDMVLTDINVPEMTGDELASRIRNMSDTTKANIPIIALTAEVLWEEQQRYTKSGIDKVLGKPFRENELIISIASYLHQGSKELVTS